MRKSMMGKKPPRQSMIFAQSLVKQHGIELQIKAYEEIGAFVNFILEVKKDGQTWETKKRYSEFHFFQQAVQPMCGSVTKPFPHKTVNK
jgi:hypothetical protein